MNINIIQSSQSCVTYKQRKVSQAPFSQADRSLRRGLPPEPEKGLFEWYQILFKEWFQSVYNDYVVFRKPYS